MFGKMVYCSVIDFFVVDNNDIEIVWYLGRFFRCKVLVVRR